MNEIKEIMNGNIKILNMRIEGETIGFDTPYNSNWNCMVRDVEQIIDTLQQENARLKDKLNKINDLLNEPIFEYDNIPCTAENEIIQIKDILKEN